MTKSKAQTFRCAVEATLSVFGGKYKAIILWHLNVGGTLRYGALRDAVPHATPKMLAQQLRELVADGLVSRRLYPVVPPKTEYTLTPLERTLVPIVNAMNDWGHAYLASLGVPDPCPEDTPPQNPDDDSRP